MSADPKSPAYIAEYIAAMDRTADLGLQTPPRVLLSKICVDPDRTLQVLLDYFARHTPAELIGQTAAINLALIPILLGATGVRSSSPSAGSSTRAGRDFNMTRSSSPAFSRSRRRPGDAKACHFICG